MMNCDAKKPQKNPIKRSVDAKPQHPICSLWIEHDSTRKDIDAHVNVHAGK